MYISKINPITRKILLTTMFVTSAATVSPALNTLPEDSFEKQKIETVDKSLEDNSLSDKLVSVVKGIDNYDSRVFNNIKGTTEEPISQDNKLLMRILAGLAMSVVGNITASYRGKKGCKHIAKAETGEYIGFASGFLLPGITTGIVLATSLSTLAGAVGKYISKENTLVGKISAGAAGLVSALKFFF